jgi:hypothetical protein
MAMYKLIKTGNAVQVLKDNQPMSLYRDIHDLGIEMDGWGGFPGPCDQIAFALTYDYIQDLNISLDKYLKIVDVLKHAAPLEIELPSSAIDYIINQ